ncbi:hypothetical protein NC652_032279 [Populus alba x Populus x berolinensis]|nr:hypothetical protein NC652_032279 [Populus alba x Populus x berolinensis]
MARLSMSSILFVGLLFVSSLLLIASEARLLKVVESHGSVNKGNGAIFSDGLHIEEIKNSGPSEGGAMLPRMSTPKKPPTVLALVRVTDIILNQSSVNRLFF